MAEFDDSYVIKNKLDYKIWRKVLTRLNRHRKFVIFACLSIALVATFETLFTYYLAMKMEQYLPESGLANLHNLSMTIIIFVLIILVSSFGVFCFLRLAGLLEMHFYEDLTSSIFTHLQHLPFSFYDKNSVGWLMARVTSDTERLGQIVSWGMIDIVWAFAKLLAIFVLLMIKNPLLAIIMVVSLPFLLFVGVIFRNALVKCYRLLRKNNAIITGQLNEGISGAKTTKSLVLEKTYDEEFKSLTNDYRRVAIKASLFRTLYFQVIAFSTGAAVVVTGIIGGNMVLNGLSFSVLYLFIESMRSFFEPVLNFASINNEMKHAQVSAERVFNILEIQPEIADTPEVIEKYGTFKDRKKENWEAFIGDIEFRNVSFSYIKDQPILDNFSFKARAGESIAIVGETGAGKTTIINLLCRFYEPTGGTILIDGKDYKERSLAWLHSNLGYVQQSPQLFSGTIKENIRYGNIASSDEDIVQVAKLLGADEFIQKLENGYDTDIGEGGNKLSLGQKQMISFARALIANPRLIVLDEATSSIDTETEQNLQRAINVILKDRTSFLIAHRLSTIVNVDKIIVLKKGKIIEMGDHKSLLAQKGYYFQLYTNQAIEDYIRKKD